MTSVVRIDLLTAHKNEDLNVILQVRGDTRIYSRILSLYAVPEIQAAAEVGAFPITLHPPLPSLMHPRDQAHLPSSQTELDTSQTGLEVLNLVMLLCPTPSRGPPVLPQPTPPYGPTLDSDSQSSNVQNPTTQFSTVFSVW